MNAEPVQIHQRRCLRHGDREAAARCPACGGFFCRECVVEHKGRLLCTTCLAVETVASEAKRARLLWLRRQLLLASAVATAGLLFYGLGSMLMAIPPEVHEGTIWAPKPVDSP